MKRKLHSPRNLFWSIWPLILFYRIIGLAPFSVCYVLSKKKGVNFKFNRSKLWILYNTIFMSIIIGLNYITIPYRYQLEYPNKTMITTSIEILQAVLGTLVICAVLLCYCINHATLVRIGNRLIDVRCEIGRIQRPVQQKRVFPTLFIAYLFNSCLCIVLVSTEVVAFQTSPVSWLTDIVPTTFAGWLHIQYFSVVFLLEAAFVDVNRAMQSLSRNWSADYQLQSLYRTRRVFVSGSSIQPLLQLRDIHDHLCEITNDVSQFYSVPVLFVISFVFLTLIYNVYYLISPLVDDEILDYVSLVNTIFWIVYLLYPFILLTDRITKIVTEIEKTGNIVHALSGYTIDCEAKKELMQFSLQLLHRKCKFTASGFFVIDNTIFHSIVATATTYLVILIQFQMGGRIATSTTCDLNCTR